MLSSELRITWLHCRSWGIRNPNAGLAVTFLFTAKLLKFGYVPMLNCGRPTEPASGGLSAPIAGNAMLAEVVFKYTISLGTRM